MGGCNEFHKNLIGYDNHVTHAFTYTDLATRLAATGFVPEDVGKTAFQEDNQTLWVLVDDSPIIWKELTNTSEITISDVIPASSTKTSDTITFSSFLRVEYVIVMYNTAEDKYKSMQLSGAKISGADVNNSNGAVLGGSLNIVPQFSKSGADAILEFVNSESFDVNVRISKSLI